MAVVENVLDQEGVIETEIETEIETHLDLAEETEEEDNLLFPNKIFSF